MAGASPDYLQKADLEERVGAATIVQLFDDDGDGLIAGDDLATLNSVMAEAEAFALARLLRNWSEANAAVLAANDPHFTSQVAWVAVELGSERRGQFISEDGKGRYWAQYERARDYFDAISKSRLHSKGQAQAGKGANSGGALKPRTSDGKAKKFVFASDTDSPTGRGGF